MRRVSGREKMNLSEIAFRAAEILSERGLARGWLIDSRKRVCNNGALLLAMGAEEVGLGMHGPGLLLPRGDIPAWDKLQHTELAILAEKNILVEYISEYNDLESVSAEDVILLLKETGKRLETEC
jgi:hypothetical protein